MGLSRASSASACILAIALLFSGSSGIARSQPDGNQRLHSPRAAVQTLLVAFNISRANPAFFKVATSCLDLGGLSQGA